MSEDGYLYLTDRKAYMIIRGGVNIYPQEAENVLITHPKVFDCAVIGVPNEEFGEEVKGVVQPMDGSQLGPNSSASSSSGVRANSRSSNALPRSTFRTSFPGIQPANCTSD